MSGVDTNMKEALEKIIAKKKYKIWIEKTTKFTVSGDSLIVTVPSKFLMDQIRNKYSKEIKKAAKKVAGRDLSIEFSVNEKEFNYAFR